MNYGFVCWIFGYKLSAGVLQTQTTQACICCLVLNKTTDLGAPKRYPDASPLDSDGRFYLLLDLCLNADCQTNFVYLLINTITMRATMKYIHSGLILDFILPPET
jgi:hypothetical protein